MTAHTFFLECLNVSMHVNGVSSRGPYITMIDDRAHVVMDNLGDFKGAPEAVLRQMVAAAKKRTSELRT